MSTILIKDGHIIDPASKTDKVADIFVKEGKISEIGSVPKTANRIIDAGGLYVVPGLIDMHTHLREPGEEEEETIASGAQCAVSSGVTTLACMPNTEPVIDNEGSAAFVILQAKRAAKANVFPIGAVTHQRAGERLSEMGGLVRGGAVAFSDDGSPVKSAEILRRALLYAKMFNKTIINHCEDTDLSRNGVMHGGYISMILGLSGISSASEEIMVARDITLCEITGGRLHIAHVSTKGSVELIRNAKKRSINVTCEATPHHFTLTDKCVESFNPNFKMNPPLRTENDVAAIKEGLRDGTIDVIASDHAPHSQEDKELEFSYAPFGVIGIETLLPITITELVKPGILSLAEAIRCLTINPARVLSIDKGSLEIGKNADIAILDLDTKYTNDKDKFESKSRNTPF
ncbi:MAG: dihydroorotase, partial [Planctomycetota bacterium]